MNRLCLFAAICLTVPAVAQRFPAHPNVVDVTQPPYRARGDGVTDDTEAVQRAIDESVGRHKLLFFPKGTYVVSRTITWPKQWKGKDNWGMTYLRGESLRDTVIRLKDNTFTNEKEPAAIMWCGGFGSADWFHNYVENLTFDVGKGNPGAVGLQFYSNNSGAVRDCRFQAAEDSGLVGLDLGHRDMNGPLLVKDCEVRGFKIGIATAGAVNGQTFEGIVLRGQHRVGIRNEGQSLSIRELTSESAAPAVMTYGTLALMDSRLAGQGDASGSPAIINFNGGRLHVRDVVTTGYKRALADLDTPDSAKAWRVEGEDKPGSLGPTIGEYHSEPVTSPFSSVSGALRLPVRETPEATWDDPATWAIADRFGADATGREDASAAIQEAMDSGATTVFLPGSYRIDAPVVIRGKVRRVVGLGGMISYGKDEGMGRDFRIEDGAHPSVTLEHFAAIHGGVEIATRRTMVFRSVADCDLTMNPNAQGGELFAEDFVTHKLVLRNQRMWARQLNVENEGTHIENDDGHLWVLGYKTERGGTLLSTRRGGQSEIIGGFSYTTTAGKLAPMFVNADSAVWAFFAEVCYTGEPFAVLVDETRGNETRTVRRGEGDTLPYIGVPR